MKKYWEYYFTVTIAVIVVALICLMSYHLGHKGGWYCEYCHEGSYRGKFEVEQDYGNKPCKCSEDSCHHFKFYLAQPIDKPKYVK